MNTLPQLNGIKIHMNLNSIHIEKNDIDKASYAILQYAFNKKYKPPFYFTANITTKDIQYLSILKNNNIRILDTQPQKRYINILIDNKFTEKLDKLLTIDNIFQLTHSNSNTAQIFIDWDNIQVSYNNIEQLFTNIKKQFNTIHNFTSYEFYVFLSTTTSKKTKSLMKELNIYTINIVKDKSKNSDIEIIRSIQENIKPYSTICIASGDRDFSPIMVNYVRNKHNVILIYNKQALISFKNNKHWTKSIDINNLIIKTEHKIKKQDKCKRIYKTKPCRFYNLYKCNSINCSYLHVCGHCGGNHKMSEYHPEETKIKNIICKKYNMGICQHSNENCDFLHICKKCKGYHSYIDCNYIIMHCPICKVHMTTIKDFIKHQFNTVHIKRLNCLKKIFNEIQPSYKIIEDI